MISFLSAIVVMLAIGTIVQRADILSGGDDEVVALIDDEIVVRANALQRLEIFENDTGLTPRDQQSLAILSEPGCGRLLVGGGVVKYYATDDCAGEQTIVYTLTALPDTPTATVTAFVTSERYPDVVPGAGTASADEDEGVALVDNTVPSDEAPASEETATIAAEDSADDLEEDATAALSGAATPAVAALPDHGTTEEIERISPRDDSAEVASDTDDEPDTARAPGDAPVPPVVAESGESGVVAVSPDERTTALAPDQPLSAVAPADGEATISLAVIPRRDDPRGDSDTARSSLIAPADDADAALIPDDASDSGVEAGHREIPGELPLDIAALDPGSTSERSIKESAITLTEAVPTGRVPIPVRRAANLVAPTEDDAGDVAADDGDDSGPDREVAALDPVDNASAAGTPETRVPLGADLNPQPLSRTAGSPEVDLDLSTGRNDPNVLTGEIVRVDGPGDDEGIPEPGLPIALAPTAALGPVAALNAGDSALSDGDARVDRADAPVAAARNTDGGQIPSDKLAALSPGLGDVPRADAMHSGPEPDPVERVAAPPAISDPSMIGPEGAVVAPDGGSPGPVAERIAALVTNNSASSYSFFTPVPRREERAGDERVLGAERPAGGFAIDLPDAAPSAPSQRVAALSRPAGSTGGLGDVAAPGPSLDGFVRDPDDKAPAPPVGNDGGSGEELAALGDPAAACVTPSSAELEIRRGARTVVRIIAPCRPNGVAELNYSGLRLAIPLNDEGMGSVLALGFEATAAAKVRFQNDETLDFDLPFRDIDKVDRIAVIWDVPIELELHALEFGATIGDPNHVNPENPRDFKDVRRTGGGFLHNFDAHAGVGQNAQIYSLWRRRASNTGGIVKLMIDYASRSRDRLEGTCDDGIYAAPGFVVLRSTGGRLERPIIRRLAALECSRVPEETGDKRLISGAIGDLVVTN